MIRNVRLALAISLTLGGVAGCGSEGGAGDDDGTAVQPLYALLTLVWSGDAPSGYVALTKSLDDDVSLETAHEFAGYSSIGVVDGQLLVNPGADDPTIERYRITDKRGWVNTGTLSFANEGAESIGFQSQYMRRGHEAYVGVDATDRVVWDPSGLEILGSKTDSVLPVTRDGLELFANFNRTTQDFVGEVLRPFSYHDESWFIWSPDTKVVVYDPATHDAKTVIDAPCPGLDSITRDEAGNTYLGSLEYPAIHALVGTGAPSCTVRLTADNRVDASWNTDLTSMTDGRMVVNFRYVGGGKAIAAVMHDEAYAAGFDFAGLAADPDLFWDTAWLYHRLWMFDLEAHTAAPVRGIDEFPFVSPGFFHAVIDDRVFVFLSDGSVINPASSVVYEIGPNGQARRRFELPGSVTQWVRLR